MYVRHSVLFLLPRFWNDIFLDSRAVFNGCKQVSSTKTGLLPTCSAFQILVNSLAVMGNALTELQTNISLHQSRFCSYWTLLATNKYQFITVLHNCPLPDTLRDTCHIALQLQYLHDLLGFYRVLRDIVKTTGDPTERARLSVFSLRSCLVKTETPNIHRR